MNCKSASKKKASIGISHFKSSEVIYICESLRMDDILGVMNFTISKAIELEDFQNKRSTFEWISIGALILSSICLTLHLIAFLIIPSLRKHSGNFLASLCFAFLGDHICLTIAYFYTAENGCTFFSLILYYFALAPNVWIAIIGFVMWKNVRESLATVTLTSGNPCNRFVCCSLLAWLLPGVAVFVAAVIDQIEPTSVPDCFVPGLGRYMCWFSQGCSAVLFHNGPVIFYVSIGILFLILVGITILTCKKSDETTLSTASQHISLKPFVGLVILSYCIRILELSTMFLNAPYLHHVYMIFNSIIGIYFFIGFTCAGKACVDEMKY